MQVAYVETVGKRRCGAVVVGEGDEAVRLIDNVPSTQQKTHHH